MQGKQRAPLAPATMLWLIQRDFLEGKTVQAMVKEALEPVPNTNHDLDIDQVSLSSGTQTHYFKVFQNYTHV